MIFWAQWGNPANTLAQYSERARDRLGPVTSSTFGWLRPALVRVRPRLTEVVPTEEGMFVGLEFLSKTLPPEREFVVLARGRDDQWKVLYDTFVNRALIQDGLYNDTADADGDQRRDANRERGGPDPDFVSNELDAAREAGRRQAQRRSGRGR